MKHYILAARAGDKPSLDKVKEGFVHGIVKKNADHFKSGKIFWR